MTDPSIYQDIAARTGGDIYIGVVGPVRTGKSTFIKRFMETLVIPNIDDAYMRERAKDELPQSGSGRTIMTAEPKFVPEEAVNVKLDLGAEFSVRLIDCVGYLVAGAAGQFEDGAERMVTTPWFDEEVTMTRAAEEGTEKVIREHSTIGLVITTDGSICDIPRSSYVEAEERLVRELREIGKPFALLLNSAHPESAEAQALRAELGEKYGVVCMAVNCLTIDSGGIEAVLGVVLREFPAESLGIYLPPWFDVLPASTPLKTELYSAIAGAVQGMDTVNDALTAVEKLTECEYVDESKVESADMSTGRVTARLSLPRELYYSAVSAETGFEIRNDGELMSLLLSMSRIKADYDRVSDALDDVRESGYGIVMPTAEELSLEEPQIVKRAGRYGVRLKASAPSIHMIRADVETEVSPALGGEKASEEVMGLLLQGFDGDVSRIWDSNIFGRSLNDIAEEGLTAKIKRMPPGVRSKLRSATERIVNEGGNSLIYIIL